MAVNTTFYLEQVTWDGNTWNSTTQGTIEATLAHSGVPLEDRTGDDVYPPFMIVTDKNLTATVTLREVKFVNDLGTATSALVLTLTTKTIAVTITLANMRLIDVSSGQGRADVGATVLTFQHESLDGTTNPVT